uniref:thymidylate synthase n=1 Tax=viral metagenome TaxID=1070528 RepID=A0A6C0HIT9_9ZZZZ
MTTIVLSEENQYLQLIQTILDRGSDEMTRNGEVRSIFGYFMRFSLSNGIMPLITTKYTAWKACFRELMWFISGCTDNQKLIDQNVHIWDANGSREFLDSRGLADLAENDLGPVYGHQWRHFNAPYETCHTDYLGKGVDQLDNIIKALKDPDQRSSRRLVMSAWNPCQLDEMALPPCHILAQFNVRDGKYLSCSLYQRSGDVGLGVPFNIASYSFLTHILAKHCGLIAEEFVYCLGNAHIYKDHIEPLREQLAREPYDFPKIHITNIRERIEDYDIADIEWISPYVHHPTIKMKMVA